MEHHESFGKKKYSSVKKLCIHNVRGLRNTFLTFEIFCNSHGLSYELVDLLVHFVRPPKIKAQACVRGKKAHAIYLED